MYKNPPKRTIVPEYDLYLPFTEMTKSHAQILQLLFIRYMEYIPYPNNIANCNYIRFCI
nr:MAG TPA: hypothetical protein [Caudoviricetes sp.]